MYFDYCCTRKCFCTAAKMKLSIVFVSFALILLCTFTTTSNADTIALEKRAAVFPFERALTQRIQQELDSLNDELAFPIPRTRVARQTTTDPEGGSTGGITGLLWSVVRAFLLIPRGLLSGVAAIVGFIGRVVFGISNGINNFLNNILTWLSGI